MMIAAGTNLRFTVFLAIVPICLASSHVKYGNYAAATWTGFMESETNLKYKAGESLTECTIACNNDASCCTVGFDKTTRTCQMNSNCCPEFKITNDLVVLQTIPIKDKKAQDKPRDCSDIPGGSPSGVYTIYPDSVNGFDVYCQDDWTVGNKSVFNRKKVCSFQMWVRNPLTLEKFISIQNVFQRRTDRMLSFFRFWNDYKYGFGDVGADHWLSNDKLHILTSNNRTCGRKLKIVLTDFNDNVGFIIYNIFHIEDETSKYRIFVRGGTFQSLGGDSLKNGKPFSTPEQDNDVNANVNCAASRQAGWWYSACGLSCLNGPIAEGVKSWQSMHWYSWSNKNCLKTSRMMLK